MARFKFLSRPCGLVCLAFLAGGQVAGGAQGGPKESQALAAELLLSSGIRAGLCVHLGCGDGQLALAVSHLGKFVIQGLDTDTQRVESARSYLQAQGMYGPVSVELWRDPGRLPYADHLVNLLVADAGVVPQPPLSEILRVLVPNGVALIGQPAAGAQDPAPLQEAGLKALLLSAGIQDFEMVKSAGLWAKIKKPWPKEMDEWSHFRHGPDGNMVSRDALIGPPNHLRWISGATWMKHWSSFGAEATANGRYFFLSPGVEISKVRTLFAWDAFNGLPLWEKPVPNFTFHLGDYPGAPRQLVAAGDRVFTRLQNSGPLVALDAATGEVAKSYAGVDAPEEIICHEGKLLLAGKKQVCLIDAVSGKALWNTPVAGRDVVLSNGQVLCRVSGTVVCLDLASGKETWRSSAASFQPKPEQPLDLFFCQGGIVVLGEHRPGKFAYALSAKDGAPLWSVETGAGKSGVMDAFYIGGLVWVPIPKDGGWMALDPLTGAEAKRIVYPKDHGSLRRCYLFKATERFLMPSDMDFVDWKEGKYVVVGGSSASNPSTGPLARAQCGIGYVLANGLIYTKPSGCKCSDYVRGFGALASLPEAPPAKAGDGMEDVLFERGPAYGTEIRQTQTPAQDEWPCFRHDALRSGNSTGEVPSDAKLLWEAKLGGRPTSPSIAGGLAFVATSGTHRLHALDAATGKPLWQFTLGGPLDTPPAIHQGLCLMGCGDGWVYCLKAADGLLVWRLRAAPDERRILAFGQLESSWPVNGGVLVDGGIAYAAAGRHTDLDGGPAVYALEPETGRIVWKRRLGNDVKNSLCDILRGDGKSVYMAKFQFDPKTGATSNQGSSRLEAGEGNRNRLLDYSDHYRNYWSDGRTMSPLIVWDSQRSYAILPRTYNDKPHQKYGDTWNGTGYFWLLGTKTSESPEWNIQVPVKIEALALAGKTLWASGYPIPAGSSGGELWAVSASAGKKLGSWKLDGTPVNDGLAAANGRLYVSTQDGRLLCFGKE